MQKWNSSCDLYQLKIQQYVCKLLESQLGSSVSNTGEMQKRNMLASSCGLKWALAAQNTGKMHAPVVSIRRRKQICLQAPVVSIRLRILHFVKYRKQTLSKLLWSNLCSEIEIQVKYRSLQSPVVSIGCYSWSPSWIIHENKLLAVWHIESDCCYNECILIKIFCISSIYLLMLRCIF